MLTRGTTEKSAGPIKSEAVDFDMPHGGDLDYISRQLGLDPGDLIDFSVSTNPYGPPVEITDYLGKHEQSLARYPEPNAESLVERISSELQVDPEAVIVGNGSAELLYWLVSFLKPRQTLIPEPSFSDYRRAAIANNSRVRTVAFDEADNFAFDPRKIGVSDATEAAILGRPNNPTGRDIDPRALLSVVSAHPERLCVVDEAFIDFIDCGRATVARATAEMPNLVVLRSLTKIFAVPNARLGYLVAHPRLAGRLARARPPWPLSQSQIDIGKIALSCRTFVKDSCLRVADERQRLVLEITKFGWLKPFPSDANFVLVKILLPAFGSRQLTVCLAKKGLVVRDCRSFAHLGDRFIRVAVRTPADNDRLLEALREAEREMLDE